MPNAPNGARPGRTLAELLVTLAVSGILFALLTAAFIAHERLVSGSTAISEARGQVRQAHYIVPAILRAASLPGGDIHAVHDTLVELDYPIASAIVCAASLPARLVLAPDSIAIGQRLASWIHVPRAGDLAHVFDPGALPGTSDDRWRVAAVSGVAPLPNGCAGAPLLDPVADASHQAHIVSLSAWVGPVPAAIPLGAVVHFTQRTRLLLYASSGNNFLGASDFDPTLGRWSVVQPVSGPYAGRAGAPGLQFLLLDSVGAALPVPAIPPGGPTIQLRIRSQTDMPVRIAGMRGGFRAESLAAYITLSNR